MERLYKYLNLLASSILSFLKVIIRSKFITQKVNTDRKKCLIIGNGPSAKTQLPSLVDQDIDFVCLNKFPCTEYYEIIKPNHFVIVSREYWKKGKIEEYNIVRDNIIRDYISKTNWDSNIFIPAEARSFTSFINLFESNKNINIVFYNTTPIEGLSFFKTLLFSWRLGSPRPHNVLIPSIMNAIWIGYQEIGVIGADHSWMESLYVTDQNEVLLNQKHFYDAKTSTAKKMTKDGNSYRKLHEVLEKFMLAFRAYFELNDFSKSKNIKIFNCSSKSYIDAFSRLSLKTFLNK